MKKNILAVLCLILLCAAVFGAAMTASAAGAAHMSISSSASTVYRGDSFTLTVSLSNNQPVSNGGVILSYDSSAFTFLGGSCNVSNAALAEVSAANGGGVFVLQTDAVVSGTVFTIRMQVKADAPFGSYSISGTPSLSIPCGISGTSVSVACKHSYGKAAPVDGGSHESVCSVCGGKNTAEHTWDEGTVTVKPTCKDTGVRKRTCTACGASREETVSVTDSHTYGSWSRKDSGHSRTCSLCGKTDTASHNWNSGKVLEAATCQKTGSRKRTCTDCGAEKTETVSLAAHSYGTAASLGDKGHKRNCTVCGKEDTEAHTFEEVWQQDAAGHFRSCTGCGYEKDRAAHVPGEKATETTDQLCTVCGRILKPKGAHVHSFSETWQRDEASHWHACSDCDDVEALASHAFDSPCDTACNVCQAQREPAHTEAESWSSDATGHWHSCETCKEKLAFAPHTPGPAATITEPQVCTACQFQLAPKVPHDHVFDGEGTRHSHFCICGEAYEVTAGDCDICAGFPWELLCIVEAVVFAGTLLGLFLWVRQRKKKSGKEPEDPQVDS